MHVHLLFNRFIKGGGFLKSKRISAICAIIIIILTSLYTFYNAAKNDLKISLNKNSPSVFVQTENLIKSSIPFSDKLKELAINLKFYSGEKEQNGIYISDDSLLKIVKNPDYSITDDNVQTIINFAETYHVPTYALIIPAACSIKQQEIDSFKREQLFNEKSFLESIYSDFNSKVSSINVYPTLFANNDKYIYYRTDTNLTSLGGYYVYEQIAKRFRITAQSPVKFDIKHYNYDFYGDIYNESSYKSITPDRISSYKFIKFPREYRVERTKNGEINTYYELYPEEAVKSDNPFDIFLGGLADKIDITISAPNNSRLLIYGDKSVMSYLPFLAINFHNITFVNTDTAPLEIYKELDVQAYDKILFSFSSDNFMHNDCTKYLR